MRTAHNWTKPFEALIYPFQPFVAVFASLFASLPIWLFTIKQDLLFWGSFVMYGLAVSVFFHAILCEASKGKWAFPSIADVFSQTEKLPIQTLLLAMMAVACYFSAQVDPVFMMAVGLILSLCMPAMMMMSVIGEQATDAIHPIHVTELIIKLKTNYFALIFGIWMVLAIFYVGYHHLVEILPPIVVLHWCIFTGLFISIAIFQYMGYLLSTLEEEAYIPETFKTTSQSNPICEDAKDLIKQNEYAKAFSLVEHGLTKEPLNLELNDLYHRLCILNDEKQKHLKHGYRYISFLLKKNYDTKALDVFMDLYRQQKDLQLSTIEETIKMGQLLYQAHKYNVLIEFLDGIHKVFPNHDLLPKTYGFLAKILYEQLGRDKKAKDILEYLLVTFPDHKLRPILKEQLDKIRAKPSPHP